MSRFLETICIRDGVAMHLAWHQQRVDATLKHFYPIDFAAGNHLLLAEILDACDLPDAGLFRCRIVYDIHSAEVEFFSYTPRHIQYLKLIEAPAGYDYRFKYANRKIIEELFAQRGDADEILVTRDGWICDTSIHNISFKTENRWYTPSNPLLAGTTWKRLITEGKIFPRPIHQSELHRFESFRLFNAMNDWEKEEASIKGLVYG